MNLQHVNIKLFVSGELPIAPERLIDTFHQWIKDEVFEELLCTAGKRKEGIRRVLEDEQKVPGPANVETGVMQQAGNLFFRDGQMVPVRVVTGTTYA